MDAEKSNKFNLSDVIVLENESCYSGFLSIDRLSLKHRLYEGGWSTELSREIMHRDPGVGVLLYDPDQDMLVLVEQFRVGCLDDPHGPWTIELVAGVVEAGESASDVAVRESKEEVGAIIAKPMPVCEYYNSPGGSSEKLSIFCARVDAAGYQSLPDAQKFYGLKEEGEDIRSILMSRVAAEQAVQEGLINNAMTIIAIQWLTLNLERVKKEFTQ